MIVPSLKDLYNSLPAGHYAVGAFNVHNMEYVQAVIKAAEAENAPVILMIGEAMIPFAGLDMLATICLFAAEQTPVPVAVALDHGHSFANLERCVELGISIMFDGSHLPLEENIRLTRKFARMAHAAGVSIEGELGSVGGAEDGEAGKEVNLTDPRTAARFVEETGVDALAVAIGNCHGFYSGTPSLDLVRLERIRELVHIPLVLHGGSDLPEALSREAIARGIRKFNVGTDLKYAFSSTLKRLLTQEPMPYQPPALLGPARDAVTEVVRHKIRLFGSTGLAGQFHGPLAPAEGAVPSRTVGRPRKS
ncbi:MAG: class II fructose-bisphosphate aldolase family protein [Bacillota bacterium]|nr:class II fructose-bisphosphate aldolase family protein [Bacillota bacterium]